jgi:hypothetical protein
VSSSGFGSPASSSGEWSPASSSGYRSPVSSSGAWSAAVSIRSSAVASGPASLAIGRWVMLTEACQHAVVLSPDPSMWEPMIVRAIDGWALGVWIEHQGQWVYERPDVLLPDDGRGYLLGVVGGRYVAGCRDFATAEEAIVHWSNPDHEAPTSARLLREAVARHAGIEVAS